MRKVLTAVGAMAMVMALGGFTTRQRVVVGCGTVLTADTTLTADLLGCTGDALVIGADGITLDLDGHTVESTAGIGLRLEGHDRVTVRDGTVRGSTIGLSATDARHLRIEEVEAHGGQPGMRLERVSRSSVVRSTAIGGFQLVDSHDNRVEASYAPDTDIPYGIRLERSDHNTISGGRFSANGDGIALLDADHNTIVGNDASNSNAIGISLTRSDHNVVKGNMGGSEVGAIEVNHSSDNLIEGNRLSRWHNGGEPEAIEVTVSQRTTVRNNEAGDVEVRGSSRTVVQGNQVDSIWVDSSDRTTIRSNDVDPSPSWTAEDGVAVWAGSTRTVLLDNVVTGFADDGIDVEAPGTVLRHNTANDNGDYGIEAVPGVVDGGRNRAAGNGNPAQCLNVACR